MAEYIELNINNSLDEIKEYEEKKAKIQNYILFFLIVNQIVLTFAVIKIIIKIGGLW